MTPQIYKCSDYFGVGSSIRLKIIRVDLGTKEPSWRNSDIQCKDKKVDFFISNIQALFNFRSFALWKTERFKVDFHRFLKKAQILIKSSS